MTSSLYLSVRAAEGTAVVSARPGLDSVRRVDRGSAGRRSVLRKSFPAKPTLGAVRRGRNPLTQPVLARPAPRAAAGGELSGPARSVPWGARGDWAPPRSECVESGAAPRHESGRRAIRATFAH